MMKTKFSEDIVPISDLKVNPGKFIRQVQETHRPVVVINRGRGVVVVQSHSDFEADSDERSFLRGVLLESYTAGMLKEYESCGSGVVNDYSYCRKIEFLTIIQMALSSNNPKAWMKKISMVNRHETCNIGWQIIFLRRMAICLKRTWHLLKRGNMTKVFSQCLGKRPGKRRGKYWKS